MVLYMRTPLKKSRRRPTLYAIAIAALVAVVGCGSTLFSGDEAPDASSTDAASDGGQEADAKEGDADSCGVITCVTPPQCQEIPGTPYCDAGVSACAYQSVGMGVLCNDGGSICNGTGQCE